MQGTQHLYSPRGSTLVSCIVPVVVEKECGCNYAELIMYVYTCTHYTYMYTYVCVDLHIIPPISPPQVDYGPAKSYYCSAGKPNRG